MAPRPASRLPEAQYSLGKEAAEPSSDAAPLFICSRAQPVPPTTILKASGLQSVTAVTDAAPPTPFPDLRPSRSVCVDNLGMTEAERQRVHDALAFAHGRARHGLQLVSVGGAMHFLEPAEARRELQAIGSALGRAGHREGGWGDWVLILEPSDHGSGLHGHFVVGCSLARARSVTQSPRFSRYGAGKEAVKHVRAFEGLSNYLGKTAGSSESHPLPGGGDRVRLSPRLRADAIAAGAVTDWKRTNARWAP